uniref:Uncharacterized protein n=1 Tax=Arion vulgaris TaxID=1028688 RepID=A0A0B7AZE6_9EUPU
MRSRWLKREMKIWRQQQQQDQSETEILVLGTLEKAKFMLILVQFKLCQSLIKLTEIIVYQGKFSEFVISI